MDIQKIKELALANGFSLKEQASGNMDLHSYVYEFANALLKEATPEGFVLVPKDQAKDSERLNFMLDGSRIVRESQIHNDDYEVIQRGLFVSDIYWISGFDDIASVASLTEREAIDEAIKARKEAQEQSHD